MELSRVEAELERHRFFWSQVIPANVRVVEGTRPGLDVGSMTLTIPKGGGTVDALEVLIARSGWPGDPRLPAEAIVADDRPGFLPFADWLWRRSLGLNPFPDDDEEPPAKKSAQSIAEWLKATKPAGKDKHPQNYDPATGRYVSGAGGLPKAESGGIDWDRATRDKITEGEIQARIDQWKKLSPAEQDREADAKRTVRERVEQLLAPLGDWPAGVRVSDHTARVNQAVEKGLIHKSAGELISKHVSELASLLGPSEQGTRLACRMTDLLLAQEMEAQSRSLGDHGARHLLANANVASQILAASPHGLGARDRAELLVTSILHDVGYLTPPARAFLDRRHKESAAEYVATIEGDSLRDVFGADVTDRIVRTVATHDLPDVDWENEPITSAFRVADNLAVFNPEKTPAVIRYVPDNLGVVERMHAGEITVGEAQKELVANIDRADLPEPIKQGLRHAASEVTSVFAKMVSGMPGGKLAAVLWAGDRPEVHVQRSKALDEINRRFGTGQRQFAKMLETWGGDPRDLFERGEVDLGVLRVVLDGGPVDWDWMDGPFEPPLASMVR